MQLFFKPLVCLTRNLDDFLEAVVRSQMNVCGRMEMSTDEGVASNLTTPPEAPLSDVTFLRVQYHTRKDL